MENGLRDVPPCSSPYLMCSYRLLYCRGWTLILSYTIALVRLPSNNASHSGSKIGLVDFYTMNLLIEGSSVEARFHVSPRANQKVSLGKLRILPKRVRKSP